MSGIITDEMEAKLPKWAQSYINELRRQKHEAIKKLQEYEDADTPSPFYVDDMVCLNRGGPETTKKYIQSNWIKFEHGGLRCSIGLREIGGGREVLDIQYNRTGTDRDEILMQPWSFQKLYLHCPKKAKVKS